MNKPEAEKMTYSLPEVKATCTPWALAEYVKSAIYIFNLSIQWSPLLIFVTNILIIFQSSSMAIIIDHPLASRLSLSLTDLRLATVLKRKILTTFTSCFVPIICFSYNVNNL